MQFSRKQAMTSSSSRQGGRFSSAFILMQCFNVAAITALGVWHGYLFYAQAHTGAPLPLVEIVACQASHGACAPKS